VNLLQDKGRLQPLDQAPEASEMAAIDALRAPEREPDAVEDERVVPAQALEGLHGGATAHVVLRVNLEPGDPGPGGHDLRDVRRP
jgi:hypothetical protein